MKFVAKTLSVLLLAQSAFAASGSGFDVVRSELANRTRIAQIDQMRDQLSKQLDRLNDEKGKLDRQQNLDSRQLVEILSGIRTLGRCQMNVSQTETGVTITVVGKDKNMSTATFSFDRLKHAHIKIESRMDDGRAEATVIAEDMKDIEGNESKVYVKVDQNNQLQEMRFKTERKAGDFDSKECRN